MKRNSTLVNLLLFILGACTITLSCASDKDSPDTASGTVFISATPENLIFDTSAGEGSLTIKSDADWQISSSESWCSVFPSGGLRNEEVKVQVKVSANNSFKARTAVLNIKSSSVKKEIIVEQAAMEYSDEITAPDGYFLVWHDEFDDAAATQPDLSKWWYEEWAPGFVNNELQRYVAGARGSDRTAEVSDGTLKITARKSGNEVISARLNTRELWTYGWFEARLKLPKGRGTWPAFWMMPADGSNWPYCGEIDIMEGVGTNPNYTSSSIHTKEYNHTIGTQKTAERLTPGAEDEFHIYALEWTPDYIKTYVDGKLLFSFFNDKAGRQETWPFDKPFHPILNLAWGGSWGGMNGVDENALPATFEIDYVRVFQK